MILDTTLIVDLLRGDSDAAQRVELLKRESRPQKISSITVLEVYEGVGRTNAPQEDAEKVLGVLDSKAIVDADGTVMRKAGKLSGDLINRGCRIDREDCVIAATALLHDEPVLTRNTAHFERIDGLDVRSY